MGIVWPQKMNINLIFLCADIHRFVCFVFFHFDRSSDFFFFWEKERFSVRTNPLTMSPFQLTFIKKCNFVWINLWSCSILHCITAVAYNKKCLFVDWVGTPVGWHQPFRKWQAILGNITLSWCILRIDL